MLWRFRKTSETIPVELHRKIAASGAPIMDDGSRIIGMRLCSTEASTPSASLRAVEIGLHGRRPRMSAVRIAQSMGPC